MSVKKKDTEKTRKRLIAELKILRKKFEELKARAGDLSYSGIQERARREKWHPPNYD